MKYGLFTFLTADTMKPNELAPEAEARGFESLFLPEHTHIPAERTSPYPAGGELPSVYWGAYDPFVALAAAASVTKKIRLGTGICLVVERDPITLAKEIASLDVISDGRVLFGIGGGWNAEEMANHGTRFETRWKLVRERIEAMKAIWTQKEAEYHGEYVNFGPMWSEPKPVQKPHPPILFGGDTPMAPRRAARYCDGWMPIASELTVADLEEKRQKLRAAAEQEGRDPDSLSMSLFAPSSKPKDLEGYEALGIERTILPLPSGGRDQVLPVLDAYAKAGGLQPE